MIWGGGKVTNGGILNINSFLANGDNSHSHLEDRFCTDGPGPGMDNAYDYLIHLICRTHGPNINGSDQLTGFIDCNSVDADWCSDSPIGDGSCNDYQDSIHFPGCS